MLHGERPHLRVIIVDDERPAREDLRRQLAVHAEVEVVGEAGDVPTAANVARQLHPDVIFLDVEMPGGCGFDLLDRLTDAARIVFVTAYDQYAVRAFDVNAVDYLLKPVLADRLELTVRRLLGEAAPAAPALPPLAYGDRIFVNTNGCYRFIEVSAIRCILADDDYTRLLTGDDQEHVVLKPLKEWEDRLPPGHFLRIHRSAIVNLNHVERIEQWFSRTGRVHVRGVTEPLPMSQRFNARFRRGLAS